MTTPLHNRGSDYGKAAAESRIQPPTKNVPMRVKCQRCDGSGATSDLFGNVKDCMECGGCGTIGNCSGQIGELL